MAADGDSRPGPGPAAGTQDDDSRLAERLAAAGRRHLKAAARRRLLAALRRRAGAAAASATTSWWGWVAAAVAAAVVLVVLVLAVVLMLLASGGDAAERPTGMLAASGLPAPVVAAYRQAAAGGNFAGPGCSMSPAVLAAIGEVESSHGTAGGAQVAPDGDARPPITGPRLDGTGGTQAIADTDGGRWDGDTTWDRAVGPMQHIPTTWQRVGRDANRDGTADPHNIFDAAAGSAVHLCSGHEGQQLAGERLREALYGYNPSQSYVDQVMANVVRYEAAGQLAAGYGGTPTGPKLLANPRVTAGRLPTQDLRSGRVDGRIIQLAAWIARRHTIHISSLKTGHSKYVAGTNSISTHWLWRGMDLSQVDGQPVSASNAGAAAVVDRLASLPASHPLRPDEVGSPFGAYAGLSGFFTDAAHGDHLHFGYEQEGE